MNLILSFLILGLVIFVHELGHFLIAKAVKAPVYKFAIGMGPIMVSKTIGETEYSIRWIPLGGFVQLELEEEFELNGESAFRKLNVFKKGCVYIAGSLFNFILAFIIFFGIFFYSGHPSTTIGNVYVGSPAQEKGLQPGDLIISIDDKEIKYWTDITSITSTSKDSTLSFKIKRDSEIKIIEVKPELDKDTGNYIVGITPEYKKDFIKSFKSGIQSTIYNIKYTYEGLIDAITGIFNNKSNGSVNGDTSSVDDGSAELSGPIGTIQLITEQTKQGFVATILLTISINLSLGVFNLLPIPGLDGGKIVLLIVEFLRCGKKMSIDTESKITIMGILLLLGLTIYATWNDIIRLF